MKLSHILLIFIINTCNLEHIDKTLFKLMIDGRSLKRIVSEFLSHMICWTFWCTVKNLFSKCVSTIVYVHIFLPNQQVVPQVSICILFIFQKFELHFGVFNLSNLCSMPKFAYKYADGNLFCGI